MKSNEYIFPTAATTTVYLNGLHVEHAFRVDWKEDSPRIPIYGYNDKYYSRVATGRSIVQGLLVINFIYSGYLYHVLEQGGIPNVPADAFKKGNLDYLKKGTYRKSIKNDLAKKIRNEVKLAEQANDPKNQKMEYIQQLFKERNRTPNEIALLKEVLRETHSLEDTAVEKQSKLRTLSSPLENQAGDLQMDVYFQDPERVLWRLNFRDVYFTSVSQQASIAGAEGSSEPLYEIYEFIASRRMLLDDGDYQ